MRQMSSFFSDFLTNIIIFIGGKKMKYKGLATVYAYLIIDGERSYVSVPKMLKKQVKEVLIALGAEEFAVDDTTEKEGI